MKAIIKREFNAYFNSMLGYVFLTIFLMLTGVMFYLMNIASTDVSMSNFFLQVNTWSVFILPILTMRVFAEDRKLKTEKALLTAPVSVGEIVFGKFIAVECVFMIGVAITLFYPAFINLFGHIPIAETFCCYVGFVLLCSLLISIGMFLSSTTDSQIIAALATYAVLILMFFAGKVYDTAVNPVLVNILAWFSPMERYYDFTHGVMNFKDIFYYISTTALFLFFSGFRLEMRRLR